MSEAKKDEVVDHYETYEEYLNVFISEEDMLYLGEEEIARYQSLLYYTNNIIFYSFHYTECPKKMVFSWETAITTFKLIQNSGYLLHYKH